MTTYSSNQSDFFDALLGRKQQVLDLSAVGESLKGKTLLVTGAAGSVGVALIDRLCTFPIAGLIALDQSELGLYSLGNRLGDRGRAAGLQLKIANIRDHQRLERIFSVINPDVVLHTAALKHVPFAEANPSEAVLTNTYGTELVAHFSGRYGVKDFLLVSTDKAVQPCSVMGASKALAERCLARQAADFPKTRFKTVRLGNVLGSSGSVLPRFTALLAQGKALPLTDSAMKRLFVRPCEASALILQALNLSASQRGQPATYGVDQGVNLLIKDLALRVALWHGQDCIFDMQGLRPGERLEEYMSGPDEVLYASGVDGLKIVQASDPNWDPRPDPNGLQQLFDLAHAASETGLKDTLFQLSDLQSANPSV